jgi:membrane-bound lytic murein transglycosylase MltF
VAAAERNGGADAEKQYPAPERRWWSIISLVPPTTSCRYHAHTRYSQASGAVSLSYAEHLRVFGDNHMISCSTILDRM